MGRCGLCDAINDLAKQCHRSILVSHKKIKVTKNMSKEVLCTFIASKHNSNKSNKNKFTFRLRFKLNFYAM